jgi:hypothetical protein
MNPAEQIWLLDHLRTLLDAGWRIVSVDWETGEVVCLPRSQESAGIEVEFESSNGRERRDLVNRVVGALRDPANKGSKIPAIKLYKEHYGCSLADAKRAVEDIAVEQGFARYAVDGSFSWL